MRLLNYFNYSILLKIIVGVIIFFIVSLSFMFHNETNDLEIALDKAAKSNKIQMEYEGLLNSITKYENNLLSFITTKESIYFRKHLKYNAEINFQLKKLDKYSSKQPKFIRLKDSVNAFITQGLIVFNQNLSPENVNTKKIELRNNLIFKSNLDNLYIQSTIYNLISDESKKVNLYTLNQKKSIKSLIEIVTILAILCVIMFLLAYYRLNNEIINQKKYNTELKFLNETLNNAEQIAGFGHWKVNLKTKQYVFSDNYYRLMGQKPGDIEFDLNTASKYIHPDDLEALLKIHKNSLENKIPTSTITRYLLPNKTVKYFRTEGKFVKNSTGEDVKIAVNYDITEQYLSTLKLEESNKKLLYVNAELESFNSIMSHDLQEPLRKIQIFISRIESIEAINLTNEGKDYFGRIKFSADRMQNLIIDLVNYSRALKGDKIFVKININTLLSGVLEELSLDIEEKNAQITIGILPEINGISFQVQQLFVNLISNSLKYSKADTIPNITLVAEKIMDDFIINGNIISDKTFYKIIISDNGIGFDQIYNENIFLLFKRLNTDNDHRGTGLGLAICKRILENHNGYIQAIGELGIGAKLILYFPK